MKTYVSFRSDRFPPDKDPEQHLWNEALAEFLVEKLRGKGLVVDEACAEDWGYRLDIENDAFDLWVGCGNVGEDDELLVFVEPHEPEVRRFFKTVSTVLDVTRVTDALRDILAGDGIRDVKWFTHDEWKTAAP